MELTPRPIIGSGGTSPTRFIRVHSQAAEARSYRRALELAEAELAINPKHASTRRRRRIIPAGSATRSAPGERIAVALAEGEDGNYVHYYAALVDLGLGDEAGREPCEARADDSVTRTS